MVPSLARDHPHTYEPIASRARLVAPHTQTSLAHWDPSRAKLVRVWAPLDSAAIVLGDLTAYAEEFETMFVICARLLTEPIISLFISSVKQRKHK
jgi:hypothetical protein